MNKNFNLFKIYTQYAIDYFTKEIDEFTKVNKEDIKRFKLRMAEDILKKGANEPKLSDYCFSCGSDEYDITESVNSTKEIEWVRKIKALHLVSQYHYLFF